MKKLPTARPLTPQNLMLDFGGKAGITREAIQTLFHSLAEDQSGVLTQWSAMFGRWAGRTLEKIPQHLAKLAARYNIVADGGCPDLCLGKNETVPCTASSRLLFAMQTYYVLLVNHLAKRSGHGCIDASLPGNPFAWCESLPSKPIDRLLERIAEVCSTYQIANMPADEGDCDLFKPLYQSLFPRPLRHQLGEYYTPDWLAAHVLDQVGYVGQPGVRLLDPACGSGTFLMMALRRWRLRKGKLREGEAGRGEDSFACLPVSPSPPLPLFPVVGFDLNPLAVITARANFLIVMADMLPKGEPVDVPVYLYDSILGQGEMGEAGAGMFDFVVGNPPWIAWDNLPDDDRQATKPLWERYGLFSLSGNAARHGGGKKDLSMLMLYAAADRYLKPHGRLGMVITQTLFQTKGAGDGFRRFRLGQDGPPLGVLRVDDMVALRPFDDAANWTSTIVLEKGEETRYPLPYFKWGERREKRGEERIAECEARPIDPAKPTSPWTILEKENGRGATARGAPASGQPQAAADASQAVVPADYIAHLGANSGGANGVYWLEVLGPADGGVRIRNLAGRGKNTVEAIEDVIEPDLLYPLLRWGDVGRFTAAPKAHLLLAQDPATRAGIEESVMRTKYPRTLAYLERFRELLTARAAYRRYQQRGPFYSMYNVGPYTVAPIKVVWRRMDRRINAAVVEACGAGVSPAWKIAGGTPAPQVRPPIPQETCVLVACDSSDEAHYLCAMLNSAAVNAIVAAHSVRGGKGFGTPGMFDYLPLRRYRPDDLRHAELAELSRQAHEANDELRASLQRRIDELV